MDEDRIIEIRKKILEGALKTAAKHFPLIYALMCFKDKTPYIFVRFSEAPSLNAIDLHDYIYTRFGLDPRFYTYEGVNPMTRYRMLRECEFVVGDREAYQRDLEETEREVEKFKELLRDVASKFEIRES